MINFDNAATTAVYSECAEIIEKYNREFYFNPSARYKSAIDVTMEIRRARESLAKLIGAKREEIFYTSSGTEGDNWAIFGTIKRPDDGLIVSSSEHAAVYNPAKELKARGYDVSFAPVTSDGSVDIDALESLVSERTTLVSVMHVNNETGAVNDLAEISRRIKRKNPRVLLHSDGVQAFCKIPVNVSKLGVDLYTISGHKVHAPKGVAALYVKKGVNIRPLIYGGGQEGGMRSSTENVGGIIAFSLASGRLAPKMQEIKDKNTKICKFISDSLSARYGNIFKLNTDLDRSSGSILNFSLSGMMGEVFLHSLEVEDILISTGSACSTKKGISRIPEAIGLPHEAANGTVRLSFSEDSTMCEAEIFVDKAIKIIDNLINYRKK